MNTSSDQLKQKKECALCGEVSFFIPFGSPSRPEACCPECKSLERHRLFSMWLSKNSDEIAKSRVLHFAAEECLQPLLRTTAKAYTTADFKSGYDLQLNMEQIDLPQDSFDCVICNHVLEHVDDRKATKEIHRILSDNGHLIASVPIIEGWETTYENPAILSEAERTLHFGQFDHVRFYGRDFRDRVCEAGFVLEEEFTAGGEDSVKHGLIRGEKIFIFRKK